MNLVYSNRTKRRAGGYLHIEPRHTAVLTTLPFHHRDPFEKMLIAQATVEGIPVLTADKDLDAYPIQRIW